MGKYQGYEKYKDSGVEWLGEIPEHWQSLKIKRLTVIKRGASPRPIDDPKYFDDDGEYAWVRIADVTASERYLETTTQKLSELGKSFSVPLEPGKLFLSIAGSVGKPIITKIKCCIHDGFVYFPDLKINEKFIYYIFNSGQPYLGLGKLGTQLNLNTETVGGITIGLPPLDEQETIARFLDHKTKQIDDLIAKKEALLEKLDEKRTALISHAVTKGLDPSVPMKDSGIEWLGEIPEHWELKRLKFAVSQIIDAEHKTATYDDDGDYLVVRTANVRAGKLLLENAKFTNESVYQEWTIRAVPEKGDILFTREAPAGEACLVPEKPIVCLGQRMVLFKFNKNQYDGYFLLQSLYSGIADQFIKSLSLGSTVTHFNMSDIGSIPLFIPPYNEQKKIGKFLAEKINNFDEQVKKVKTGIELLKEYRTALITNAVTGKIDVRQVPIL
ncbi:restriction modification system DNA specificity domain protein [Kalymmatonema gypsitolerans NIES-4073]|nr:restriction modification system DNA specificity domain protein [Scytonema sp. NIES-4073]